MKKLTTCKQCKTQYDAYLNKCPCCGEDNKTNLERQFSNMLFLTDYKEFLLLVVGFLGLIVFSLLASLAIQNFPIKETGVRVAITNFIVYLLALGVISCVVGDDYIPILNKFKETIFKYKRLLIVALAVGIMIGFSYAYQGILNACHVSILNNDNQKALVEATFKQPVLTFFAVVLFAPIVEEFAYRLGLFSLLRKRNRWVAYVVSVIFFTLIHFNYTSNNLANECLNLPNYIVPAILLAALYEYQGIPSSILAHVLNNLISYIIIFAVR